MALIDIHAQSKAKLNPSNSFGVRRDEPRMTKVELYVEVKKKKKRSETLSLWADYHDIVRSTCKPYSVKEANGRIPASLSSLVGAKLPVGRTMWTSTHLAPSEEN